MKFYLCLFALLGSLFSFAQTKPNVPPPPPPPPPSFIGGDDVFKVVEKMPRYPGCEELDDEQSRKECSFDKMLKFIYSNVEYPELAANNGTEGTVVIQYVVDETGAIVDPKIVRDIGDDCGNEALRVVELMPKWIPGYQEGKAVKVVFNLPVKFKLQEPSKGIFFIVPNMPKFSGCELSGDENKDQECSNQKIMEYLKKNMQYPEMARKFEVEGECKISFVVNELGEVIEPRIERDMGAGCGVEALRLIKEMPKWVPGKKDGAPVKVQMMLPVIFKL